MVDRRVSLSWHTVGEVTVIRVDTSTSSSALDKEAAAEKLNEIAGESSGKLVLDMSAVELVDSRMLAAIVSLNRKLGKEGGQLRMCSVAPLVKKMLDAFGLLKVLKVDDTEQEAIAALSGATDGPEASSP